MKLLIITQKVDEKDQVLSFFIRWLQLLSKHFSKVTVICLERGEFNLPQNVKVISLGKDRGAGKLKQLFTFYFLLFTLRRDYDAIFVHMNPVWVVLGGWWWRLTEKKIFLWYTHKSVTFKLRLAEKLAYKILTASKESFRIKSNKIIVTGHGIDIDLFRPATSHQPPATSLRILSVGRIALVKNYETLVEAAKILKDEGMDFSITMVGEALLERDKRYERKLKLLISNYQLQKYFNFVGGVNHKDLPEYYQSHDIFVHLSKTGSLDKSILEAIACGMNVLSSNDSSKMFLKDNLVFKENDPNELVDKIKNLRSVNYGMELRNYVLENHNLDNLIDKISKIINGH